MRSEQLAYAVGGIRARYIVIPVPPETAPSIWEPVPPDTAGETELQFGCRWKPK
jgi:hypothetical protein